MRPSAPIHRLLLWLCLISIPAGTLAQTDTVQFTDIIGVRQQRILWVSFPEYSYYKADHLTSEQIRPLLSRSLNADVRTLNRRSQRLDRISNIMTGVSFPAMFGGLAVGTRQPEIGGPFALGGIILLYGGLIPGARAERLMGRAVTEHNRFVRAMSGRYYNPAHSLSEELTELTLADTVAVWPRLIGYQYTYRGMSVSPDMQLQNAFNRLGNERIKSNSFYNRTIRRIGGLVQGIGSGVLFGYLTFYGLRWAAVGQPGYFNRRLFWSSLGAAGAGAAVNFHAAQIEARSVRRYNELLRERVLQDAVPK